MVFSAQMKARTQQAFTLSRLAKLWPLLVASIAMPSVGGESAQEITPLNTDILCQWALTPKAQRSETVQPVPSARIGKIIIQPQDIFAPAADNIWIHDFANWAHITTKASTIERELSIKSGEIADANDLAQAERLLRDKSYIRDAEVKFAPVCNADQSQDVLVTTSDQWSLLPSIGFGRSGGSNKSTLGFKEDNLLGLGVRTSVRYQSNVDRSGYEFKVGMPLGLPLEDVLPASWVDHSYLTFEWTNNDDGHLGQVILDKPFYQDDTPWMYRAEWLSDVKQSQIRHNGELESIFASDQRKVELSLGQLLDYSNQTAIRLSYGIEAQDWLFNGANPSLLSEGDLLLLPGTVLPEDRSWRYPFVALEYKQFDYRVLSDILFIDRHEDVNLGWHHQVRLGVQTSRLAADSSVGYRLVGSSSKGLSFGSQLWLLSGGVEINQGLLGGNFNKLTAQAEQFYRLTDNFTWYNQFSGVWQNRAYLDTPLELGGDSGLRGYPLQYQHGTQLTKLTSELRWYPRINLYKLLDVGFVAFADYGRVSGGDVVAASTQNSNLLEPLRSQADLRAPNLATGWLGSVGVGARIYSNRSSNDHVVHIDLSTPLSSEPGVDSWEISLKVSNRF